MKHILNIALTIVGILLIAYGVNLRKKEVVIAVYPRPHTKADSIIIAGAMTLIVGNLLAGILTHK